MTKETAARRRKREALDALAQTDAKLLETSPPIVPEDIRQAVEADLAAVEAGQAVAEAQPAPEAQQPAPQIHKIYVLFDYWRADGSKGNDRAFINARLRDIRTELEVYAIEQVLLNAAKGQFIKVMLTGWKGLEG